MKILFLSEHHPGSQGGIQTLGRVLKNYFGKDLKFLSFKEKDKNFIKIFQVEDVIEIKKGNFIFKVLNKILRNSLREYQMNKIIKEINPDIVILGFPHEINYLKNIKCKKILVQHINYDIYIKNFFNYDLRLIEKIKEEIDKFIFLSKFDLEIFREKLKLNKEKIKVIRHSSEVDLFFGSKEKNKNLIMVARLQNNHKRFDLVIKAMKKLQEFNLKIYGDGPDKEDLQALIDQEKVENVYLMGGTNKIQKALDKASIFIMTSDFEGYGITNIEAMRRGLPIILRNTFEAALDIIVDNQNGILLAKEWNEDQFIEAVYKIYDNYEYYSKNALILARRYNSEVIKEEWRKIIYE